jgi:dCMP deaminase
VKRNNYISWEDYFMGVAELSAQRSKDPKTQVGCSIIDPKSKHILSIGYNGLPKGFNDDDFH